MAMDHVLLPTQAGDGSAVKIAETPPCASGSVEQKSDSNCELCTFCSNIFDHKTTFQLLASRHGLEFKRDRKSMMTSAVNGCHLCRELLSMPYDFRVPTDKWKSPRKRVRRSYSRDFDWPDWLVEQWKSVIADRTSPITPATLSALFNRYMAPNLRFHIQGDVSRERYLTVTRQQRFYFRKKLYLGISTRPDDPASDNVLARSINRDVRCKKTYAMIRKWLAECDQDHNTCKPYHFSSRKTRPTLLVDVLSERSEVDVVKLHIVGDEELSYAALSYCWGAAQPKATTSANFKSYLGEIVVGSLPQSLRDAVWVTRMLELRYLWVDSLCIIQDSEDSKVHEIGRMEHIYHNAYVTISANSASHCNAGFLDVRAPSKTPIALPFRNGSGTLGCVDLKCQSRPSDWQIEGSYPSSEEPINRRAWTFQESFMSRRMLIYSHYQLFWVCSGSWGQDGGTVRRQRQFHAQISSRTLKSPKVSDWDAVIKEYCSRELTNPADKLAALSSIAGYFANLTKDKYLAGLWAKDIRHGLCWTGLANFLRRPRKWRAPSWSFLSVDGRISIESGYGRRWSKESFGPTPFLTILSCHTIPLSQKAPFGQVVFGYLKVRGRLLQVQSVFDDKGYYHPTMLVKTKNGAKERVHALGSLHVDTLVKIDTIRTIRTSYGDLDPKSNLFCLMLCQERTTIYPDYPAGGLDSGPIEPHDIWEPWGLTLAKHSNGAYHRVGYFSGSTKANDHFKRQQLQDITIL